MQTLDLHHSEAGFQLRFYWVLEASSCVPCNMKRNPKIMFKEIWLKGPIATCRGFVALPLSAPHYIVITILINMALDGGISSWYRNEKTRETGSKARSVGWAIAKIKTSKFASKRRSISMPNDELLSRA